MQLIIFLQSKGGLAFLHFTQTILFSMMVYILVAEYIRTKQSSLVYKLIASCFITIINAVNTFTLVMEIFYNLQISQRFTPLILNTLFSIIVLALARAFLYDFVKNKKRFVRVIHYAMGGMIFVYIAMQIVWLSIYKDGMIFASSYFQLVL